MFGKGKINLIRTFALGLCFGGMIVTYGSFLTDSIWISMAFLIIGIMMVLLSTVVYFWIGYLSTKAVYVECPSCHKTTKVLGKIDECMFCRQKLTFDKSLASAE